MSASERLMTDITGQSIVDKLNSISIILGAGDSVVPAILANQLPVKKDVISVDDYIGYIRPEIAAGNFKHARRGTCIKIGDTEMWVAGCDWLLGKGDQTSAAYQAEAYGTHHLLVMIKYMGSTSLWLGKGDAGGSWQVSSNDKGRCPWNAATDVDPTNTNAVGTNSTNITRQYNGANVSGYMGSFIRERMDAVILPYLQTELGSANVLKFRNFNGNAVDTSKTSGGQGTMNGCTSGWGWYDRYLDLPGEVEVFGSRIWGSAMDSGIQCEQLPLFKGASIQDIFGRLGFWTKAVASPSAAAFRDDLGSAHFSGAGYARWACPLAAIK